MQKLDSHSLYDRLPEHRKPPPNCPDPLCVRPISCISCPLLAHADASAPHAQLSGGADPPGPTAQHPSHSGWGGRRPGAGAPKGSLNHFKHGQRSALVRSAVNLLAEHKELRPFLLLIARAAVEGEIPQTTRQLIIKSLGETTTGMQLAARQLRRLRDGQEV